MIKACSVSSQKLRVFEEMGGRGSAVGGIQYYMVKYLFCSKAYFILMLAIKCKCGRKFSMLIYIISVKV